MPTYAQSCSVLNHHYVVRQWYRYPSMPVDFHTNVPF